MANKRTVKKHIDNACYSVIHDCMTYIEMAKNEKSIDETMMVMSKVLKVRNDLINSVNQQAKTTKTNVKAYYNDIYKDLEEMVDSSFSELSAIIKE